MTKTKACPKCGSTEDVVHKDRFMKEQDHAAVHHGGHMLDGAAHGHPLGLIVVASCWIASRLLHRVSKPWTCRFCGHDFA